MKSKPHPLFPLRPQTRASFAKYIDISYDTLKRRIKAICPHIPSRKLLMPDSQKLLLKELGYSHLLETYDNN